MNACPVPNLVRPELDQLDPAAIERETPAIIWKRLSVVGFSETGSTNDEAIRLVRTGGAPPGLLVFAEHQTSGRGRRGRSWNSRPGSGLCFSLVVNPPGPRQHWPLLSLLTSVALARSLGELHAMGIGRCALRVDLKWPNDVLLSGKKVAGILIEAADRPGGSGTAAVIGVGVNVGIDSVPDGMEGSATSVSCEAGDAVPRRVLIVTFLRCFQQEYESFERGEHRAILERWRSFSSMWDGTRIWLSEGDTCREATTCGLSDHGALRVRLSDGTEETVLAADVSVRYDSTDHPKLEHE